MQRQCRGGAEQIPRCGAEVVLSRRCRGAGAEVLKQFCRGTTAEVQQVQVQSRCRCRQRRCRGAHTKVQTRYRGADMMVVLRCTDEMHVQRRCRGAKTEVPKQRF